MNLSVVERLQLLGLLPKEGDFITLKIVRDLQGSLSFSEDELKEINLSKDGANIHWDKEISKDVQIGERATDIIVGALKRLNDSKKLTLDLMGLYEKFCG